eukprot:10192844-Ditylum_brightwellii.AAC.1
MRAAVSIANTIPNKLDGTSPYEKLTGASVLPKLKNNHAFGYLVYALDNCLQAGQKITKWNPWARLGLNLGPSLHHAATVNLVLSLETGLALPQFHIQCDNFFETVRPTAGNADSFSNWQTLAGLKFANRCRTDLSQATDIQGSHHASDEALAPPPKLGEPLFVEPDPNPDQDEETPMAAPQASPETMQQGAYRLQRVQVPTQKWFENEEQKDLDLSVAYSTYYDVPH